LEAGKLRKKASSGSLEALRFLTLLQTLAVSTALEEC